MVESLQGKQVLITVSGPDQPGITATLMKIVSDCQQDISDIGQAVTQNLLSLSFVLEFSSNSNTDVIKELLFASHRLGLKLNFKVLDEKVQTKDHAYEQFVLNCVSVDKINSSFLHQAAELLAKNDINILRIDKIGDKRLQSLEISTSVPTSLDWKKVKEELMGLSTQHRVDVAFIRDNVYRRSKRLIVFDMDSTLIQTEVIDEMAKVMGVESEVKIITEKAMNGEIDFDKSLKDRVSKLKGIKKHQLLEILENLKLTNGAADLIKTTKSLGYKVGIISGGFSFFADALKQKLGLDFAFSNALKFIGDEATGEIEGTIINAAQKEIILRMLAQQENISLEQVVAIGDGANDLPMLSAAGLGIAFHAKEIVKKHAQSNLSHNPMSSILYFLGIPGVVEN